MVNLEFDAQLHFSLEKVGENGCNASLKTGRYDDNILKGYTKDASIFKGVKVGDNLKVTGFVVTNAKGFTNFIIKTIERK